MREELNTAYAEVDRLRTARDEAASRAAALEASSSAERENLLTDLHSAATVEQLESGRKRDASARWKRRLGAPNCCKNSQKLARMRTAHCADPCCRVGSCRRAQANACRSGCRKRRGEPARKAARRHVARRPGAGGNGRRTALVRRCGARSVPSRAGPIAGGRRGRARGAGSSFSSWSKPSRLLSRARQRRSASKSSGGEPCSRVHRTAGGVRCRAHSTPERARDRPNGPRERPLGNRARSERARNAEVGSRQ